MFNPEIKALIHLFNQYGRIPNGISLTYVNHTLGRKRVKQYLFDHGQVLHVNSSGECGKSCRSVTGAYMGIRMLT